MRNGFLQAAVLIALAGLVAGCAAGRQNTGSRALSRGDYEKALAVYQRETETSPNKSEAWRSLGIAYFNLDSLTQAQNALDQAARLKADDATTTLYQGMTFERLGKNDEARALYRTYVSGKNDPRIATEIRQRLRWLEDQNLKTIVSGAVANEKNINTDKIPSNAVAVIRFDADSLPAQYQPLGRGIAELVYADLAKVEGLSLVERLELDQLRKELALSQTEFSDKYHSPRVGRLVGAARVVTGKLTGRSESGLEIDAGIIDVGPGMAKYPQKQEGKLNEFFQMQKRLSLDLIQTMGYEITPELRHAIAKPATESMLALVAYSRGLEYVDQGRYALAEAEFKEAAKEDPNFGLAQQALQEFGGLSDYNGQLKPISQVVELTSLGTEEQQPAQQVDRSEVMQRLQESTRGVAPENENPYVAPRESRGTVIVRGRPN